MTSLPPSPTNEPTDIPANPPVGSLHPTIDEDVAVERLNVDPISGATGAHPVGVGVGAVTLGAAGAAIGSIVPGLGTAVGGAVGMLVGALAGGYAGKGVAEALFPTNEEQYWREAYRSRQYFDDRYDFDRDYANAYRLGYAAAAEHAGESFDSVENAMRERWEMGNAGSRLTWPQAREAARDAFVRAQESAPAEERP